MAYSLKRCILIRYYIAIILACVLSLLGWNSYAYCLLSIEAWSQLATEEKSLTADKADKSAFSEHIDKFSDHIGLFSDHKAILLGN